MKKTRAVHAIVLAIFMAGLALRPVPAAGQEPASPTSRLAVMWTSGDPEVARQVCFMYTENAKRQKWFDEVVLIVWGPSARLLANDRELQTRIKGMLDSGIVIQACKACADSYKVTEQLRQIGVEVKYMGKPLTDLIKQGWHILTF